MIFSEDRLPPPDHVRGRLFPDHASAPSGLAGARIELAQGAADAAMLGPLRMGSFADATVIDLDHHLRAAVGRRNSRRAGRLLSVPGILLRAARSLLFQLQGPDRGDPMAAARGLPAKMLRRVRSPARPLPQAQHASLPQLVTLTRNGVGRSAGFSVAGYAACPPPVSSATCRTCATAAIAPVVLVSRSSVSSSSSATGASA